jgi:hypothetical protein
MTHTDRIKLFFGPYETPRVKLEEVVTCEVRDDNVIVVGNGKAPIPWPIGRRKGKSANHAAPTRRSVR